MKYPFVIFKVCIGYSLDQEIKDLPISILTTGPLEGCGKFGIKNVISSLTIFTRLRRYISKAVAFLVFEASNQIGFPYLTAPPSHLDSNIEFPFLAL